MSLKSISIVVMSFVAGTCAITVQNPDPANIIPFSEGPPLPTPGEDTADWLDQVFSDPVLYPDSSPTGVGNTLNGTEGNATNGIPPLRRDLFQRQSSGDLPGTFTWQRGVQSLTWNDDTGESYNLTIDGGACSGGITEGMSIGTWTFANGTVQNDTTLIQLIQDLWSLAAVNSTRRNDNYNPFSLHVFDNAQALQNEAQTYFDSKVCTNATVSVPHDELRKLLVDWQAYYLGVILTGVVSGTTGVIVSIIADKAWAPHNITGKNQFQTGTITTLLGFAGGIIQRQAEIGRLDRDRLRQQIAALSSGTVQTVRATAGLVPAARAAVVESIWIALARRLVALFRGDDIARRNALANLRQNPKRSLGYRDLPTNPDGTPAIEDPDQCVSLDDAEAASTSLNTLLSTLANDAAIVSADPEATDEEKQAASISGYGLVTSDDAVQQVTEDATSDQCPSSG